LTLKNKVIVVTGGLGLLGKSFIENILKNGGVAVLTDINMTNKNDFISRMNNDYSDSFYYSKMDITNKKSVQSLIKKIHKKYGYIDSLVNSAYPKTRNYGKKNVEEITYDDFTKMIAMHIGGYFLTSQQFGIYFKKRKEGNIINVSSIYGTIVPRFEIYKNTSIYMPIEYAAIKSSINHVTRYFAHYFKKYNIRVNSISPGGIYDNQPKNFISSYSSFCSKKGLLDPQDISNLILFLLSDTSKYITGQNLVIDDGFSL